ncbi:hypothetical protein Tco_0396112 [Tanacetum coccineum]
MLTKKALSTFLEEELTDDNQQEPVVGTTNKEENGNNPGDTNEMGIENFLFALVTPLPGSTNAMEVSILGGPLMQFCKVGEDSTTLFASEMPEGPSLRVVEQPPVTSCLSRHVMAVVRMEHSGKTSRHPIWDGTTVKPRLFHYHLRFVFPTLYSAVDDSLPPRPKPYLVNDSLDTLLIFAPKDPLFQLQAKLYPVPTV